MNVRLLGRMGGAYMHSCHVIPRDYFCCHHDGASVQNIPTPAPSD